MNNPALTRLQPTELSKRARIIIVDDFPPALDAIELCLREGFQNLTVKRFWDGEEAWSEIQREEPDYLISDLRRAGTDGFELLRRLAARQVRFPVLIISAILQCSQSFALECAGPNMNVSFLEKPFDAHELISKVAEMIMLGK